MQTINLNNIENKGNYWLVNYDNNQTASIAKWNASAANILEMVGKGQVMVAIEKSKDGKYTNITAAQSIGGITLPPKIESAHNSDSILSIKDEIIVAQVILKEANNIVCAALNSGLEMSFEDDTYAKWLTQNAQELTATYKVILSELRK